MFTYIYFYDVLISTNKFFYIQRRLFMKNYLFNEVSFDNFYFAVGVDNRGQLGNVSIKKGQLSITPKVKDNISSTQLATLRTRSQMAYEALKAGTVNLAPKQKDNYSIYNFCFSIIAGDGSQIGNVVIRKNGDLFISPGVSKKFQDNELATICSRALMAYSILKIGDETSYQLNFKLEQLHDHYVIKQIVLGNEAPIASILDKNKHLLFHPDIPRHIRCICIQSLKKEHMTDFYYQGALYS